MLNNKKLNFVIAIVISVLLWAYVIGEVNPTTTQTFKSIPIRYVHSDVLAERGLAVSAMNVETIDVEIAGTRADVSRVDPDDIFVVVDVATANKGSNEVSISTRVPNGITVTEKSMDRVTLTVETLLQKTVPVEIVYTGTFEPEESGKTVYISSETVDVSGAESLVNIVDRAVGSIDASRVTDVESETDCTLHPVSKEGSEVVGVSLLQDRVNVGSVINVSKSVELSAEIIDEYLDGYIRLIDIPSTVTIIGDKDSIEKVESIQADTIDLSNYYESVEIEMSFSALPEGIDISDKNEVPKAQLSVTEGTAKTIEFKAEDIKIVGAKNDFTYKVEEDYTITVLIKGKQDTVRTVGKDDVELSVNVSELKAETESLDIEAKCDQEILAISVEPAQVKVKAEKK